MRKTNRTFEWKGTTQFGRAIEAIRPEYVRIDDRTLQDLLAFAAGYSKLVNFYNDENKIEGNWEDFYLEDISVLLAVILSTDVKALHDSWQSTVYHIKVAHVVEEKVKNFNFLFERIYRIFFQFDNWYARLSKLSMDGKGIETDIHDVLFNVISSKLSLEFQRFKIYKGNFRDVFKVKLDYNLDRFQSVWDIHSGSQPKPLFEEGTEKVNPALLLQRAIIKLQLIFESCMQALLYLLHDFEKQFHRSLTEKHDHKADTGLFIAFLGTFEHLQEATNYLSNKVLDLYYGTVLNQKKLQSIPDLVYVHFDLATHLNTYSLPSGTQLVAGRDTDGESIYYETLSPINLNHARVSQLKTLYFHKDPRETMSNYEIVTHVFSATDANSKDGKGEEFDFDHEAWPTFGESQLEKLDEHLNMEFGELGFAISSPIFFLREGKRKIDLTIWFNQESIQIYDKLVRDVRQKFDLRSNAEAFYKVFNPTGKLRNISIFASGSRGWIPIDPQLVKVFFNEEQGWNSESFTISFLIDVSDPPVIQFNPPIFPHEYYSEDFPVIKVVLNGDREPYAYSFLKQLRIDHIDINVEVDRIKRFQIYNNIGQVDSTQPFQPFGAVPSVGSYLLIGNSEIFQKDLDSLDIDIKWQDIPQTAGEFRTYYYDYNLDAKQFKVAFTALSKNEFIPDERSEPLEFSLFSMEDVSRKEEEDLPLRTQFKLSHDELSKLEITPEPLLPAVNSFDNNTQSGYFKIELVQPEDAFGHAAYQTVITKTMSNNSKLISDAVRKNEDIDAENLNVPNPPLTPLIKDLSLRYRSSQTLDINEDDPGYPQYIYHVQPFGTERTYPNVGRMTQNEDLLFPQFDADGYLFIGIENARPLQTIHLLFQLVSIHIRQHSRVELPELKWQYLARNNQWKALDKGDFQSDSTDSFTKSGIVAFRIPRDASLRSSVLPPGMYWVRIEVTGDVELLGHTLYVHTQAVCAQWVNNGKKDYLRSVLPPETITRTAQNIAEIRSVIQPFESFGGRAAENSEEFFTRVSERIRHKNRAVTFWDYERIVLHKFPIVFQVKCLSTFALSEIVELSRGELVGKSKYSQKIEDTILLDQQKAQMENTITLVVVPKKSIYRHDPTPVFNYKALEEIQSVAQKYSSPFVRVHVRNPVYEYFRVYCKVKFTDEGESGAFQMMLFDEIKKFACPWMEDHSSPLNIGGSISVELLKQHLSTLPYVRFITKFSLLHIIELGDEFRVEDTAESETYEPVIHASMPWSVLIPDTDHEIELMDILDDEIEELAEKVKSPVRFKTRHNILNRTTFIRIIRTKPAEKHISETGGSDTYSLNIKI